MDYSVGIWRSRTRRCRDYGHDTFMATVVKFHGYGHDILMTTVMKKRGCGIEPTAQMGRSKRKRPRAFQDQRTLLSARLFYLFFSSRGWEDDFTLMSFSNCWFNDKFALSNDIHSYYHSTLAFSWQSIYVNVKNQLR